MKIRNWFFVFMLALCANAFAAKTADKDTYTYTEDKLGIAITADHPQFVVKLKSNPSTGYSWFLRDLDTNLITAVKHEYLPAADRKLMGAPGFEVWTFRMKPAAFQVPQQTLIRIVYARPWEGVEQAAQVVFRVSTLGKVDQQ